MMLPLLTYSLDIQSEGELTTRPVIRASDNSALNNTDTF